MANPKQARINIVRLRFTKHASMPFFSGIVQIRMCLDQISILTTCRFCFRRERLAKRRFTLRNSGRLGCAMQGERRCKECLRIERGLKFVSSLSGMKSCSSIRACFCKLTTGDAFATAMEATIFATRASLGSVLAWTLRCFAG